MDMGSTMCKQGQLKNALTLDSCIYTIDLHACFDQKYLLEANLVPTLKLVLSNHIVYKN